MRTTSDSALSSEIIAGFRAAFAELRCIGSERMHRAGVSMAHFHLLSMLDRHGDTTMSRIAELLDVSLSNATGLVDRIEERGLVERIRVPDDRRVVQVRLTAEGYRLLREVELIKDDMLQRVLGRLDPEALRGVATAMTNLRRADRRRDEGRPHPPPAPRAPPLAGGIPRLTSAPTRKDHPMEAMPSVDHDPSLSEDPALGLSRRQKFEILGAVMLALFLGALDQTVVSTAMPQILTDLNGSALYTWVVTIYLLTSTVTVPFYGKLSDLFGRRPLLLIGITTFLIGSALSGLSQNMEQLILFRAIQGVGAGALFPISLAVIGDLFTPAERGRYQGLFGAVFGLSFLLGPAIGGLLTDLVSWHWVFYVNIPIGIVSLIVIWRLLPTIKRADASRSLDYLGAAIFTVAISFLLVGLTNKSQPSAAGTLNEWTDMSVGGFILIALVLSAIFLVVEARAKEPIVPLGLWRDRTYASSIVSTFLVSFGFFAAIIFLPRWFQVVRGESATLSGYLLFPLLIGLIGSSIISGIIVSRTGRYKAIVLTGLVTMTVGLLLMGQLTATTDYPPLFLWMFVTGVGIGPTLSVFTIIVQNAVPFSQLGVATSNLTFFRQIGGSVGLAIAGTIFGSSLQTRLPTEIVPRLPAEFQGPARDLLGSGGSLPINPNDLTGVGQSFGEAVAERVPLLQPLIADLDAGFHQAMALSIADTFGIGIITTVLAFGAALVMRELPLRSSHGEAAVEAEAAGDDRQPSFRQSPATE